MKNIIFENLPSEFHEQISEWLVIYDQLKVEDNSKMDEFIQETNTKIEELQKESNSSKDPIEK